MSQAEARRIGVVGDLSLEDDLMHPVSEDGSHNESMFFNFFDTAHGVGGFVRIGNRPNEGHAEMTFCIFQPDGSILFQWGRPAIDGSTVFDAAGLSFRVIDPGRHQRIRFEGQAVRLTDPLQMADPGAAMRGNPKVPVVLELDCRGTGPMIGSASGTNTAVIFLQDVGHYQQACAYEGAITVGGRKTPLQALGVRDHSWGKRVWHDLYQDRSFWACASPDLAFIACKTWNGAGQAPDVIGCVIEDGVVHRARSVALTTRYVEGTARHRAFDLTIEDVRGRRWALAGEVQAYIPLRHRKPDKPVLHLGQAMSRFTLDGGPSFLGLSEYFDAQAATEVLIAADASAGVVE